MPQRPARAALLVLLALSFAACGGEDEGAERGPCYGNGTCNAGLVCLSDVCVRNPEIGDAGGDSGPADFGLADLGVDAGATERDAAASDATIDGPLDAGVDASTIGMNCDPWGERTCAAGERCRADVDALVRDRSTRGVCQPVGTLGSDARCTIGADDECMDGFACANSTRYGFSPTFGVCRPLCGRERGLCAGLSSYCAGLDGLGMCFERCDPLRAADCPSSCVPQMEPGGTVFLCMGDRGVEPAGSNCDFFYACAPGAFCEAFLFGGYACSDYCDTAGAPCANGATCTVLDGNVGYCPQPS